MGESDKGSVRRPKDEGISIRIADNKMEAFVIFTKPENGGKNATAERVEQAASAAGIIYGLDSEGIRRLTAGSKKYGEEYKIAAGKPAKAEKDGRIEFLFGDTSKNRAPKLREDGTVDYRSINSVVSAEQGDLLARTLPPGEGEFGINVTGGRVIPQKGKPAPRIPRGKNTSVNADGTELRAEAGGHVIISNNVVSISEVLEIKGDVDNSTGNIEFGGSVIINGNIMAGFIVNAMGNVDVRGFVECADIICKGDLLVEKGIIGMHKSNITVGGNLFCRTVQEAKLNVGGDITGESIMHSELKCNGRMELRGRKGLLVGGSTACRKEVDVNVIGSPMGTQTDIKAGIEAGVFEHYRSLLEEYKKLKKQYETLSKDLGAMGRMGTSIENLPESKKRSYIKTLQDAKEIQNSLTECHNEILSVKSVLDGDKYSGRVIARSLVHPGVNIQIGNAILSIRDQLSRCKFINDEGAVKVDYNI